MNPKYELCVDKTKPLRLQPHRRKLTDDKKYEEQRIAEQVKETDDSVATHRAWGLAVYTGHAPNNQLPPDPLMTPPDLPPRVAILTPVSSSTRILGWLTAP